VPAVSRSRYRTLGAAISFLLALVPLVVLVVAFRVSLIVPLVVAGLVVVGPYFGWLVGRRLVGAFLSGYHSRRRATPSEPDEPSNAGAGGDRPSRGGDDSRLPGPLDGQTGMLLGGAAVVLVVLLVGVSVAAPAWILCDVPVLGNDTVCAPPYIEQQPNAEKIYVTGSVDGNPTEVTVELWAADANLTANLEQTDAQVRNSSYNAILDLSDRKVMDGEKYVVAVFDQNKTLLHQNEFTARGWGDKKNKTSTPTGTPDTVTPTNQSTSTEPSATISKISVAGGDATTQNSWRKMNTEGKTLTVEVNVSSIDNRQQTNVRLKFPDNVGLDSRTQKASNASNDVLSFTLENLELDISKITLLVNGTEVESVTEAKAWISRTYVLENGNVVGSIENGTNTSQRTLKVAVRVDQSQVSSKQSATVTLDGDRPKTKNISGGTHNFTFDTLAADVKTVELSGIDSDTLEAPGGSSALTDVAPHERTRTVVRVAG
jgi:hypothetical protein